MAAQYSLLQAILPSPVGHVALRRRRRNLCCVVVFLADTEKLPKRDLEPMVWWLDEASEEEQEEGE
jgi:hypothetical protein